MGTAWIERAKLTSSDGGGFGGSVDISVNTIVISSTVGSHVFEREDGSWTETAVLGDVFGPTAISGNTIVVGDPSYSGSPEAAYVFERDETGWIKRAELTALQWDAHDHFGVSVAIGGETIVVGANGDDETAAEAGAAYVFTRPSQGWVDMTETAKLTATNAEQSNGLGGSVAISEDTIVAGAPGAHDDAGSAYVFARPVEGWVNTTESVELIPDPPTAMYFGNDVGVSGALIVARASHDVNNILVYRHHAHVFTNQDCNGNDIPDECDIAGGSSDDCTGNGMPDECEPDCNGNALADSCDIADGTSADCANDGVPDECEPDCNGNSIADSCDIAAGSSQDCDLNGIPDSCDVAGASSSDCNSDQVPDECQGDCNNNYMPDNCDIATGFSEDCTSNGTPDECEPDCNGNGTPDSCDVLDGISLDCDGNENPDECDPDCNDNGFPDACDVAAGTSIDCNNDAIPDECQEDCNRNGVHDLCDVAGSDCNSNSIPDDCEAAPLVFQAFEISPIGFGVGSSLTLSPAPPAESDVTFSFAASADLDAVAETLSVFLNGTSIGTVFAAGASQCPAAADTDQIVLSADAFNNLNPDGTVSVSISASSEVAINACAGSSFVKLAVEYVAFGEVDCNNNDIPDDCEDTSADCNNNGIWDGCDPALDTSEDCTGNGIPDECEPDCNGNALADSCDIADGTSGDCDDDGIPDECQPQAVENGSRYITIHPQEGLPSVALLIRGELSDPDVTCVSRYVQSDGSLGETPVFRTPAEWCTVHAHGPEIIPDSLYDVLIDDGKTAPNPLTVVTAVWGDSAGLFVNGAWEPADGTVNITDAVACVDAFAGVPSIPLQWCDLDPEIPDGQINIIDILRIIEAFAGVPYPHAIPCK